jgi:hypothetical protein
MSAAVPKLRPARAVVTLKDGRRDAQEVTSHRGDFNQSFAESEGRDLLRRYTRRQGRRRSWNRAGQLNAVVPLQSAAQVPNFRQTH